MYYCGHVSYYLRSVRAKVHYRCELYYAWVQMLLQMGPLLRLGPNVITDGTFITLESKMLLQMGPLLRLGPNVITDGTFITLESKC